MWAMGAGAIPVPFVDVLGIAAVQLRMVKQLCALYGLEFNERDARSLIAALLASMGSVAVGTSLLGSLLKVVPVLGQALGGAAATAPLPISCNLRAAPWRSAGSSFTDIAQACAARSSLPEAS